MSDYKFCQTPNGNLTVLSIKNALLIWINGVSYMIAAPDHPMSLQAKEIDIDIENDTPDEIFKRINEIVKQKKASE